VQITSQPEGTSLHATIPLEIEKKGRRKKKEEGRKEKRALAVRPRGAEPLPTLYAISHLSLSVRSTWEMKKKGRKEQLFLQMLRFLDGSTGPNGKRRKRRRGKKEKKRKRKGTICPFWHRRCPLPTSKRCQAVLGVPRGRGERERKKREKKKKGKRGENLDGRVSKMVPSHIGDGRRQRRKEKKKGGTVGEICPRLAAGEGGAHDFP